MKARRLQTQLQFQALRSSPPLARTEHFVLHRLVLPPLAEQVPLLGSALFSTMDPWLGAATPKRWAKRAVTRNLIKRQIYSVGERHLSLPNSRAMGAAYLVRLRAAYAREQFHSAASDALRQAVRTEIEKLFARATDAISTSNQR